MKKMPFVLWLTVLLTISAPLAADKRVARLNNPIPAISIIIDDLGEQLNAALRVLRMPAELTYSILPHTTHSNYLARLAHSLDKETMLHLPMQSINGLKPGKGALTTDMSRAEFSKTLRHNLAIVPYVRGINNHMGSLLTQRPEHMKWLMQELIQTGNLYFIDSRTTAESIAFKLAQQHMIPSLNRNIFLDNEATEPAVKQQFEKLLDKAQQDGFAIAIGHPYPATLAILEKELPRLEERGIQLLPVSKLLQFQRQLIENPQWRLAMQQVRAAITLTAPTSTHTLNGVP